MALTRYIQRWAGGFADNNNAKPTDAQFLNAVETALLGLLGADPTDQGVQVYDAALSRMKSILLTNAQIDPAAAIAKSKLAALGITDADVAAGANIATSKLGGNLPITKLAGYPGDALKALLGDGSWAPPHLFLTSITRTTPQGPSVATTFAGSGSFFATSLNFNADGTSSYLVVLFIPWWSNASATANSLIGMSIDAGVTEYAKIAELTSATAGAAAPLVATPIIVTPAAGALAVQVRAYVGGGSVTLTAGTGGPANVGPAFMGVVRI